MPVRLGIGALVVAGLPCSQFFYGRTAGHRANSSSKPTLPRGAVYFGFERLLPRSLKDGEGSITGRSSMWDNVRNVTQSGPHSEADGIFKFQLSISMPNKE